jgi:hypothetical protein
MSYDGNLIPLQMDFSGYHQVLITEEDQAKTKFVTEWGSFSYTVIPFGLENVPMVFSKIVVDLLYAI